MNCTFHAFRFYSHSDEQAVSSVHTVVLLSTPHPAGTFRTEPVTTLYLAHVLLFLRGYRIILTPYSKGNFISQCFY